MDEWLIRLGAATLLIAVLAFVMNQLASISHRRTANRLVGWRVVETARLERETLLNGLYGEVCRLDDLLTEDVAETCMSLKLGWEPSISGSRLFSWVFLANAGKIGGLRDRDLVAQVVEFYSLVEALNRDRQSIDGSEGADIPRKSQYFEQLLRCSELASRLHSILRNSTRETSLDPELSLSIFKSKSETRSESRKKLRAALDDLWLEIARQAEARRGTTPPNPGPQPDVTAGAMPRG